MIAFIYRAADTFGLHYSLSVTVRSEDVMLDAEDILHTKYLLRHKEREKV